MEKTLKDFPCIEDDSINITIKSQVESYNTWLAFNEIDLKFRIKFIACIYLSKYESNEVWDIARVFPRVVSPDSINQNVNRAQLGFVLDGRTSILFQNTRPPKSSFKIHNKEFKDVYETSVGDEFIEIYFNLSKGLVAFRDKTRNLHYKFERVE